MSEHPTPEENPKFGPIYKQCWSEVDATTVNVRGVNYLKDRQKGGSKDAVYHLLGVDLLTLDKK